MQDSTQFPRNDRRVIFALFALTVVIAAVLRLVNIRTVGFAMLDPCLYWQTANEWARGQFVIAADRGFTFLRPALYALGAAALHLFDFQEYSIRLLHALMDLVNIGLTFFIAVRLSRSPLAGLGAAALYSVSPLGLTMARTELAHTPSTTFVLLALAAHRLPFVSGLSLGTAACMHADLSCLAPGFVAGYVLLADGGIRSRITAAAQSVLLFSFGFFLLFAACVMYFGWDAVSTSLATGATYTPYNTPFVPGELTLRILTVGVARIYSPAAAIALYAALILALVFRKQSPSFRTGILPFLLIVSYAVSYEILISRNDVVSRIPRILVPLAPLVAITIAVWFTAAVQKRISTAFAAPIFFLGTGALCFSPFVDSATLAVVGMPSTYRSLHDTIGSRTGPNARVLIAPTMQTSAKRCFQSSAYFGSDAVYIHDCTAGSVPLEQFAVRNNIRFVYLAMSSRQSYVERLPAPKHCFGWPDDNYSSIRERDSLISFIESRHGKEIASSSGYGKVYELGDPPELPTQDTLRAATNNGP